MRLLLTFWMIFSNLISPFLLINRAARVQSLTAYELISAVNVLRASHGLAAYGIDPLLMLSAQMQADYIASQASNSVNGHVGPGGTDADARAFAVGFTYVQGLDINENWCVEPVGTSFDAIVNGVWSDALHMHTMLHPHGQLAGAGISVTGNMMYIILDVAAYWGDAGKTPWPTSSAYTSSNNPAGISQFIAPVKVATPRPDGSVVHLVQSGQSLWSIATGYGTTIDSIRRLNNLGESATIYIGQKLLINPPGSLTPTPVEKTSTPSMGDYLLPHVPSAEWETAAETTPSLKTSPIIDPNSIFLLLFVLCGAGVILIFIGRQH